MEWEPQLSSVSAEEHPPGEVVGPLVLVVDGHTGRPVHPLNHTTGVHNADNELQLLLGWHQLQTPRHIPRRTARHSPPRVIVDGHHSDQPPAPLAPNQHVGTIARQRHVPVDLHVGHHELGGRRGRCGRAGNECEQRVGGERGGLVGSGGLLLCGRLGLPRLIPLELLELGHFLLDNRPPAVTGDNPPTAKGNGRRCGWGCGGPTSSSSCCCRGGWGCGHGHESEVDELLCGGGAEAEVVDGEAAVDAVCLAELRKPVCENRLN
mmetsp:Transcript_48658/g.121807  ORF Transcript_48658/g.121807 Transcript_48658/m.121807 type:complete len:264 (+) Transcript_48658:325-1116(+)